MDLSLFFAGTGGSVPTARRGLPALLLRAGSHRVLVDCGEGTQHQFLRSPLRLSGDVTVGGVERSGGLLRITVFRTGQQAEGRIQLVLDEEPMALRQWVVVDGQNRSTRVTLTQAEVGGRFNPALFAFNDPRFREELGERQN